MNRKIQPEPRDPWRWTRYNRIMVAREVVDFSKADHCKRCGKRWGDHVTSAVLARNACACPFVP